MLFNWTKHAKFLGSPLFQATYNIKAEKQIITSTYLVSVGCGRLAEGKGYERLTDVICQLDVGSWQWDRARD